jgi:hypothetical protein
MGAHGLKLAVDLFCERLLDHLDARLVIACHDELLIECPEEQTEEVARFLEEAMAAGMNEVLNPCLDADHPERTLPRPLPYASCAASSIPSLVGSRALKQASIMSTTDPSSVPNYKSLGMYSSYREGVPGCPAAPPALPRSGQHIVIVV